jgi:hypothetical protein
MLLLYFVYAKIGLISRMVTLSSYFICKLISDHVIEHKYFYYYSLYLTFPARAPMDNTTALHDVQSMLSAVEAGDDRAGSTQAM